METFDQLTSSSFELPLSPVQRQNSDHREAVLNGARSKSRSLSRFYLEEEITDANSCSGISTREVGPFFHPNNGGAVELAL